MSDGHRDIVYGYVRLNYQGIVTVDIINIILNYYLIKLGSNILILTTTEQSKFMDLLYHRLKQQNCYENMKYINTTLLYRSSDNNNGCAQFHTKCTDKGATITIIHNEYDHIFGGYVSESWSSDDEESTTDPNVFSFTIRPNLKSIELNPINKSGKQAITVR